MLKVPKNELGLQKKHADILKTMTPSAICFRVTFPLFLSRSNSRTRTLIWYFIMLVKAKKYRTPSNHIEKRKISLSTLLPWCVTNTKEIMSFRHVILLWYSCYKYTNQKLICLKCLALNLHMYKVMKSTSREWKQL